MILEHPGLVRSVPQILILELKCDRMFTRPKLNLYYSICGDSRLENRLWPKEMMLPCDFKGDGYYRPIKFSTQKFV